MDDDETRADNSADSESRRLLLPPEDRVWRHPSEIAMESRAAIATHRARRRRAATTLLGGVAATAALIWVSQAGSTDVVVITDVVTSGVAVNEPIAPPSAPVSSLAASGLTPELSAAIPSLTVRSPGGADVLAGALISHDGFVITSGRALDGARQIEVSWGDRTETGFVVGYDSITDVSVIRVDGPMPATDRNDSGTVTAGDRILFPDPDGTNDTQVVVNAESTSARSDGEPVVGIVELDGTLGTVRPGSPAFGADGAIIGMVTATADDAPLAVVPIALVRVVASEIIDLGAATHPLLGVRAHNATGDDGTTLVGSMVTAVTEDGPAAAGGMEVGDLIIEIEGDEIRSMESMVATLRSHEPGDQLAVVVLRAGAPVTCSVQLGSQPAEVA